LRAFIRKRLLDEPRILAALKQLDSMLITLAECGYVTLEPPRPEKVEGQPPIPYEAVLAHATEKMNQILVFRSVHPLYGAYLVEQLGIANREERLQAFESVLEMPRPLLKSVRVPWSLSPGPLATTRLDPELLRRGLIKAQEEKNEDDDEEFPDRKPWEDRPPLFAEKLFLLFDAQRPEINDVNITAVWAAGEILTQYGGNFSLFIQNRDLTRQEGIIFRHLLRLILLLEEFSQLTPPELTPQEWQTELRDIAAQLTETCRVVDPNSTEQTIKFAHAADAIAGENAPPPIIAPPVVKTEEAEPSSFGEGILDAE